MAIKNSYKNAKRQRFSFLLGNMQQVLWISLFMTIITPLSLL